MPRHLIPSTCDNDVYGGWAEVFAHRDCELTLTVTMEHPEIALVLSAVCFSLVVGFLAGYGVRAYISFLRRRANRGWQGAGLSLVGAKRR